MSDRLLILLGAIASAAMMVLALWGWQNAAAIAGDAVARPEVAAWAVRCGAVGVAAAAQTVLLAFVVGALYRRDAFGDLLKLSAVFVLTIALVSAIALGLAAR